MNTYRCAGDAGDCIAALPVVRALGGGIMYLEAATYTRVMLTPENWRGLDLLLLKQPYITDVQPWRGQPVTHNLNNFRVALGHAMRKGQHKDKSLVDWQLEHFGIPLNAKDEAWLAVDPIKIARVVINRTGPGRQHHHIYHNPAFPWHYVCEQYRKDAVFIGSDLEHEVFCATCCPVPHAVTSNLLFAAQVIAGADLFIGNQSVCFWIAEGLKKRLILEVWPGGPNSNVYREGAIQVTDHTVSLPVLESTTQNIAPVTTMDDSETSKHRHLVAGYCTGNGVDLGSSGDPVVPHAIQVDLPPAQYKHYNTTRPEAVIQWRGSALDLPFKNSTLDFVHSAHLLEDFTDWRPALSEWDRVLKPGGYMIIAVPDHGRFRAAVAAGQGDNMSHKHESHVGELTAALPGYEALRDDFVNDRPTEYSILYVGRKR